MTARSVVTSLKVIVRSAINRSYLSNYICWNVRDADDKVAITFDDGPTEKTLDILKILREGQAKATFFVLSNSIERFPKVFEEILDGGHQVAMHGSNHRRGDFKNQILECGLVLNGLGYHSKLVRPPYGKISLSEFIWCVKRGFRVILWTFDAQDSMRLEEKAGIDPCYNEVESGDIILMHDDNNLCIEELPILLNALKEKSFKAVTLDEIL